MSGGPDSLALAILADRWARERGGKICALSVDHQLRPESSAEIRSLGAWLSARKIRHDVLVWAGAKPRSGIQEAARTARYGLLAGWCREHGCLHLLTAHQREDQIETHMIRRRAGSGPDGLAGMSALRELAECRVLRPLLGFPKNRLVAFLAAEDQPFITDPSNLDPAFERSRLRAGGGIMPDAEELPALLAEIRRYGTRRADRESDTNRLLAEGTAVHPAGFAVLDPALTAAVPHDMAERILASLAATIGSASYPARRERIARLRDVIDTGAKRTHTLGGCRFVRWRDRVLVMRELARAARPVRVAPGERILFDRRLRVAVPRDATAPFIVGYLGPDGAIELRRRASPQTQSRLPRLLFPILPAARDAGGLAAVPHLGYQREGLRAAPEFIFCPVHPLTGAGFAVV
ncbi:MAG: tRNA lysidine(34) synthetase TilS [Alphaproteobacteria bacterium]|nr:tRNA lysidine(34) synthetase TilS [Alphaproteobacteria bacterium]